MLQVTLQKLFTRDLKPKSIGKGRYLKSPPTLARHEFQLLTLAYNVIQF